jgi:hypothetical protein
MYKRKMILLNPWYDQECKIVRRNITTFYKETNKASKIKYYKHLNKKRKSLMFNPLKKNLQFM